MAATTFEVHVAIDDDFLTNKHVLHEQRTQILASFEVSLNHWIAERQLELRHGK